MQVISLFKLSLGDFFNRRSDSKSLLARLLDADARYRERQHLKTLPDYLRLDMGMTGLDIDEKDDWNPPIQFR